MGAFAQALQSLGGLGNDLGTAQQNVKTQAFTDQSNAIKLRLLQLALSQQEKPPVDPLAQKIATIQAGLKQLGLPPMTQDQALQVLGLAPKATTDRQFPVAPGGEVYDTATRTFSQPVPERPIKPTAATEAKPVFPTGGGPAYGVSRVNSAGQLAIIKPGDPEFTDDDKKLLDSVNASQQKGQADKAAAAAAAAAAREKAYVDAYATARGKVQQYSVIDKTNGQPVMVNAETMNANPGRFAAGSLGQQLKNRAGVFDEINYTTGQFNRALNGLTDADFKTLPRAQIAIALQSRDPSSAMSEFIGSEAASTLSPAQIDYVTGLVSLQESAMSLRSIAGMGQGSDTLRNAITAMLPGPQTPSKDYANRQMRLFQGELEALRRSVPASSQLGMSGQTGNAAAPPATGGTRTIVIQ
jgi:hypothetical protein